MSLYSFGASNISRAKMQSAVAHYAYISGEEVENEKNGKILKYKREDKVLAKGNILPEDAPARFRESAATWVNDIEQFEKADNARPAKRFRIALPEEFDLKRQIEVVEQWIYENCTKHGYAATYAIHSSKDGKNPHVHILVSNRPLKKGRWQEAKSKTEYKRDKDGNKIPLLDPETGKQKVIVQKDGRIRPQWQREIKKENQSYMDKCSTIYNMRESWARCCNQYLDKPLQLDHRSYAARGINQAPTIHEGYQARAIEKRGGKSWKCEHNRQVKALNEQYRRAEMEGYRLSYELGGIKATLSVSKSDLGRLQKTASLGKSAAGALTKAGGKMGKGIAGGVKGVVNTVTSAPGQLLSALGGPDGEGGFDKAVNETLDGVIKSVVKLDPVGAVTSVAKMPLSVLKNVESEDVKRDKMREAKEKADAESFFPGGKGGKSKKKDKGSKGKGQGEHAPLVRSYR